MRARFTTSSCAFERLKIVKRVRAAAKKKLGEPLKNSKFFQERGTTLSLVLAVELKQMRGIFTRSRYLLAYRARIVQLRAQTDLQAWIYKVWGWGGIARQH